MRLLPRRRKYTHACKPAARGCVTEEEIVTYYSAVLLVHIQCVIKGISHAPQSIFKKTGFDVRPIVSVTQANSFFHNLKFKMGSGWSKDIFDAAAIPTNFNDIRMNDIRGNERCMSEWDGKVKLVVNVASKCGLTRSSTEDLNLLREQFGTESFEVLGFPSAQFAGQEYKDPSQIQAFCERMKISFPVFESSAVNGPETNPVFLYCKANSDDFYSASGRRGQIKLSHIGWNYGKFLLDKKNGVYKYYGPRVEAKHLANDIAQLISGKLSGMKRDANGELKST